MSRFTQNLAICLCMIPLSLTANDMQDNFDRYSKTYENTAKDLIQSGKLNNKINPQDYTKEDINNVKAKEYYDNPSAMEDASRQGFSNDKTSQAMQDLQLNGKSHIDADNPVYKKAAQTQEDADIILHDKTDSDYQCKEISTGCTDRTTTKTCQQSNHQNISCMRYPKVEIVDVPYTTQATFTGQLSNISGAIGYIIPPEKGTIISAHVQLNNYGNNIWTCKRNYWGLGGCCTGVLQH